MSNLQELPKKTKPQSVLVIRFGAMGDLLHVSPSIKALKDAYPDTTVHFLTSPLYEELVGRFSGVDQVWTFDKKTGLAGLFRLNQALKKACPRWDVLMNLHPSLRTYLLTMLLQPSQSAVYRKEKLKFFGLEARSLKRRHAIADFFLPFQTIWQGLPDLSMPSLPLQRNANRFEEVENKAKMTIGIVPGVGAKRGNRSWPLDYYEQLVKALLEDESGMGPLRIQLFGGPDEVSLCQHLQQSGVKHLNSGQLENHCAQYSILETAQAMTGCDVLLAGDTGPLHLAAATGIEVIGLFGPTSPNRTGPRGVGTCENLTPEETLTCWPCEKPVCPLSGEMTDACMKSISPERVLNRLKEIQERLIAQRQSG